ncbi:MAG: extensin family protein [Xanthobacteraceae bacterium]
MTRGVRWYLVSSLVLVALVAVAGCSHYMLAEREPWRHEAELTCLNSGAVNDTAGRVRIAAIEGPGACGIDYPLRVSALGESGPLSYDDEPVPPGSIPNSSVPRSAMPQNWPGASPAIQSNPSPPVQADAPQSYPPPQSYPATQVYPPPQSYPAPQPAAQIGGPLSLEPPGTDDDDIPGGPPHPYYGEPNAPSYSPSHSPSYSPSPYQQRLPSQAERPPAGEPVPPLGPPVPATAVSSVPVQVQPPATLACPVMSALDQWIASAVQPAAAHWFRQPVVEIKQISAYSCRGMNGNPNAHISEHAFGNALDVAEFDLADGHKISVQYGWHGTPEEQEFLHDVQAAACEQFTTVLAPGANVYHYNHIHVDLMRHYNGRHICEPSAIPGEVAAARARSQFAERHYGDPRVTGSIKASAHEHEHSSGEDDDSLPEAVPGDD